MVVCLRVLWSLKPALRVLSQVAESAAAARAHAAPWAQGAGPVRYPRELRFLTLYSVNKTLFDAI